MAPTISPLPHPCATVSPLAREKRPLAASRRMRNAGLAVRDARRRAPHHEEDPIYRHSQMAAYFAVAKIRWHRPFVQCIVLNTSISYLSRTQQAGEFRPVSPAQISG